MSQAWVNFVLNYTEVHRKMDMRYGTWNVRSLYKVRFIENGSKGVREV
jgi:hypothetical protein